MQTVTSPAVTSVLELLHIHTLRFLFLLLLFCCSCLTNIILCTSFFSDQQVEGLSTLQYFYLLCPPLAFVVFLSLLYVLQHLYLISYVKLLYSLHFWACWEKTDSFWCFYFNNYVFFPLCFCATGNQSLIFGAQCNFHFMLHCFTKLNLPKILNVMPVKLLMEVIFTHILYLCFCMLEQCVYRVHGFDNRCSHLQSCIQSTYCFISRK